jgi:hypothetical protein
LELKELTLAPKSLRIERDNLRHAIPHFAEKLLCHVEARETVGVAISLVAA